LLMKKLVILAVTMLTLALNVGMAESSDSNQGWNEAGIRMGIEAGPKRSYFHLYELFAVYGLPWDYRSSSGWAVDTKLETALGALHTDAETGAMGTLGTGLTVTKKGFNLVPELGINLSLLDRRQFGKQDFGSILLFGAYFGLSYHFDCGLGIGYRIQHLSNNHILYSKNTPNPGLDLHMIGISWIF
jgi:hypothetical protein